MKPHHPRLCCNASEVQCTVQRRLIPQQQQQRLRPLDRQIDLARSSGGASNSNLHPPELTGVQPHYHRGPGPVGGHRRQCVAHANGCPGRYPRRPVGQLPPRPGMRAAGRERDGDRRRKLARNRRRIRPRRGEG